MSKASSRDVRLGGSWSSRQRQKNNLIYHTAMLCVSLLSRLSRPTLWALGRAVGTAIWAVWPEARRRTARGLSWRGGSAVPTSPRAVLAGLGEVLFDTLALTRRSPHQRSGFTVDAASRAVLAAAVAEGRGVVFATAHLGGWERMAACLVEEGFPIATVARESYDPRFHVLYDQLRTQRGIRALYRGKPGFATSVVRVLRGGSVLGFPMDVAGRGVRTVRVPFFGGERDLPVGPATLALRTGAALVVGTPSRPVTCGGGIRVERVLVRGSAEALTSELAAVLAARIDALPTEWPWMLVADDVSPPLESRSPEEVSCATISTPKSPASTRPATSESSR